MLNILFGLLCWLTSAEVYAQWGAIPDNLVRVSSKTNPACVEYFMYQGEVYCSLKALDDTPFDPALLLQEPQQIQFDERAWQAAWAKKTPQSLTIEYVPSGQTIDAWFELVTSQYLLGMQGMSLKQFQRQFMAQLRKTGLTVTSRTLDETPHQLMFEFMVQKPQNLEQNELVKVTRGKTGLYVLHYVIKKADMGFNQRQQWLHLLKNSTLKNNAEAQ